MTNRRRIGLSLGPIPKRCNTRVTRVARRIRVRISHQFVTDEKHKRTYSHRAFIFYFIFFSSTVIFSDTRLARASRSADGLTHRATIPRCAATLFRDLTRGEDSRFNRGGGCNMCDRSCSLPSFFMIRLFSHCKQILKGVPSV